jgi:hypothetical protein
VLYARELHLIGRLPEADAAAEGHELIALGIETERDIVVDVAYNLHRRRASTLMQCQDIRSGIFWCRNKPPG